MLNLKIIRLFCTLIIFAFVTVQSAFANEPMKFWIAWNGGNCGDCTWIAGEGEITADTPADFLQFISEQKDDGGHPEEIHLNSNGGDLVGGILLGLKLRELGINTSVSKSVFAPEFSRRVKQYSQEEGVCYSACAYAFLGGKDRTVVYEKSLGFHQFYRNLTTQQMITLMSQRKLKETLEGETQVLSGVIVSYLVEIGANPQIFSLANSAGPDRLYFPTKKELRNLNIVSMRGLSEWQLTPLNDGLVLIAKELENSTELESVQIYCRKSDGAKIIMLAVGPELRKATHADKYEIIGDAMGTIDLKIDEFRREVEESEAEYFRKSMNDGYFKFYRIPLSADEAVLLSSAAELSVRAYWSTADGFHDISSILTDDDISKIKLTFKNCI